jgi:hypothetical protein
MSKSKDNVNSLLAAIQRKAPVEHSSSDSGLKPAKASKGQGQAPIAPAKQESAAVPQKTRIGKAITFWFHDEDRRLIRELSAWLAGQGLRPTDSMVVRAALRMAKTGSALVDAYRQEAELDGRIKRNKPTEAVTS